MYQGSAGSGLEELWAVGGFEFTAILLNISAVPGGQVGLLLIQFFAGLMPLEVFGEI